MNPPTIREEQLECVMNVSEGRDPSVLEAIERVIVETPQTYLLDIDADPDHNRAVFSFLGTLRSCPEAAYRAIGKAVERIDLRSHTGVHPRIGAADVIPFVPLRGISGQQSIPVVRELAARVAGDYSLPVYLYELAALRPERTNLALIRRGGLEALARAFERNDPQRVPDFGPPRLHPTAGACVIGVRRPLIAFNVYLDTDEVTVARQIARRVRERDGGLPAVKALGFLIAQRGRAQVSMNLTDHRVTSLQEAFRRVQQEARRLGTGVLSSELVGLVPSEALPPGWARALSLEDFTPDRILEQRITRVLASAGLASPAEEPS